MNNLVRINELEEFIKVTTDSRTYNVSISADIFCDILRTARAAHEWKAKHDALEFVGGKLIKESREENEKLREQLRTARADERARIIRLAELHGDFALLGFAESIRALGGAE